MAERLFWRRAAWLAWCLVAVCLPVAAPAKEAVEAAANPELEARMLRITAELRCLVAVCLPVAAPAKEAVEAAANPELEARMLRITAELRCLVCQNQTIADSHAGLAIDLRNQVREMLQRGESDKQIIDYMTARYGDFVLYRPPLKGTTAALWFGPAALLVAGAGVLLYTLRRRSRLSPDQFEPDDADDLKTAR